MREKHRPVYVARCAAAGNGVVVAAAAAVVERLEARRLFAAVSWDGGGDGTSWTDPLNWSGDVLPGADADVTISVAAASPTIQLSSGTQSIHSMNCAEALSINGGTLSLAAASTVTGALNLLSGELTGAGNLTLNAPTTWSGGTMSGTGHTVVVPGHTFFLTAAAHPLTRPLDNSGVINWTAGELQIGSGGSFNNSAQLMLNGPANSTYVVSGTGSFNNNISPSSGFVSIQPGATLRMRAPGQNLSQFTVNTGSTLSLESDFTHGATSNIFGTGTLVYAGGTQTFAGSPLFGVSTVNFTGGTIAGAVDYNINKVFNWSGGTWSGSGHTKVVSGGTLNLLASGAGAQNVVGRTFDNGGTVSWQTGGLSIGAGASFNNNGQLMLAGPANSTYVLSGTGAFNNNISPSSGFVTVPAGATLRMQAPGQNLSQFTVNTGATLSLESDFTHGATSNIFGTGTLVYAAGTQTFAGSPLFGISTVNFTGGTIAGAVDYNINKVFNWSGGTWSGSGHTKVISGGTLNLLASGAGAQNVVGRTFDNGGTVSWQLGGLAIAAGASFNNNGQLMLAGPANSTYIVSGTGAFNNNISPSSGFVTIPAGATLRMQAPGQNLSQFTVNTGATLSLESDFTHGATSNIFGTGTLVYAGGTQTFAGSPLFGVSTVSFTGGMIAGAVDYNINKVFNWSGGTWTGSGHTKVISGGTLNLLASGAGAQNVIGRTFDNGGAVSWQSGGLSIGAGASFNNNGQLMLNGAANSTYIVSGTGSFNNNISPSSGFVTVPAGATLRMQAPGQNLSQFTVNTGATLSLESDFTHGATSNIFGTGTLVFAGGTQTFSGNNLLGISTVNFTGGTIAGAGTYNINKVFNWSGGTMSAGGHAVVLSGGTLNLTGTAGRTLGRILDNNGTANWDSGDLTLSGGTFNNNQNLNVNGAVSVNAAAGSGGNAFNNNAPSGRVTIGAGDVLNVNVPGTNSATFFVGANATLTFGASYTQANGAVIDGPGAGGLMAALEEAEAPAAETATGLVFTGGTQTFTGTVRVNVPTTNAAAMLVQGDLTFEKPFTQAAGSLTVAAGGSVHAESTFDVSGGSVGGAGSVDADVVNDGAYSPHAAGAGVGAATVNGNFTQTSTGTLQVQLNGTTPVTQYDQLNVNGAVTLAGGLDVSLGFSPAVGATFLIINNDGVDPVTGTFAGLGQGAQFSGGGRRFSISYVGGTGNDVVLTALADPPALSALVAGDGTAQRSQVKQLTVSFDRAVTLAAGAVTLQLLNTGGSGANNGSDPTDASAALEAPTSPDGGRTWIYTFAGASAFVQKTSIGASTGSLVDGIYRLSVDPTKVTANGVAMAAAPTPLTFHRLFGDVDGSKAVNNADFGQFRNAFGKASGDAGFSAAFDFDNSGTVNNADFGQFRGRFLKVLTY